MVIHRKHVAVAAVAAMFMLQPAFAEKPSGAGNNGNGNGNAKHQQSKGSPHKASKPDQAKGSSHGNKSETKRRNDANDRKGQSDRGGNDQTRGTRSDVRSGSSLRVHFDDRQRNYLREYYGEQFRSGNCPPGLAKKNNGCMPPGQAKKWRVGHPLPRDVVYYDLPSSVMIHIGMPPSGYRYVRVASDILMLAVGTGMVVDAIADLSSM